MDWASISTFCIAFALSAAAPGPSNVAVFARSMTKGFWHTVPMLAGLIVGEMFFVGFAVFGLALIANTLGTLFLAVKWIGALYLAVLAYKLWTAPTTNIAQTPAPGAVSQGSTSPAPKKSTAGLFLLGLALVLGNPKTIAFYLALLPVLIDMTAIDMSGFLLLLGLMVAIYMPILVLYSVGAARIGQAIRSSRAVQIINRTAAAAMAGAAAAIVAKT